MKTPLPQTSESHDRTLHDRALSIVTGIFDSAVMQNNFRATYVEVLVGLLLGDDWTPIGGAWGAYDFEHVRSEMGLEVTASAAKQTWQQKWPSIPTYDVAPRTGTTRIRPT